MSGVKARDSSSSPTRHIEPLRSPMNYSPNSRQNNSPQNRSSPNANRNSNVIWLLDFTIDILIRWDNHYN